MRGQLLCHSSIVNPHHPYSNVDLPRAPVNCSSNHLAPFTTLKWHPALNQTDLIIMCHTCCLQRTPKLTNMASCCKEVNFESTLRLVHLSQAQLSVTHYDCPPWSCDMMTGAGGWVLLTWETLRGCPVSMSASSSARSSLYCHLDF